MIPIVFVHGLMGGSAQWQDQVRALEGFDVIALDLPGFGENAHMGAIASIADFAMWALDELNTRGIQRFHLVGHSMGGMIAQEMVARAPERIEHLVLYGTGATGVLPGGSKQSQLRRIVPAPKGPPRLRGVFPRLGFGT